MPTLRRGYLFAALILAGCASSERNDLNEFVVQSEQRAPKRVAPLPRLRAPETVVYQAFELPDPFAATRSHPPADQKTSASNWTPPDRLEPLEAYPLESLHMVGTMQRNGQRWAVIKTPDNTIYRVTKGQRLGEHFGAIVEIEEAAVVLDEHVEDGNGMWTERVAKLTLLDEHKTN